ncbi:MAG: hypothetical protein LBR21_10860 [Propionibacteriaceae bacterium]|jgi:hypothetical protein|nr:hypothetical protein [Propionibacteriaceae bacterium]
MYKLMSLAIVGATAISLSLGCVVPAYADTAAPASANVSGGTKAADPALDVSVVDKMDDLNIGEDLFSWIKLYIYPSFTFNFASDPDQHNGIRGKAPQGTETAIMGKARVGETLRAQEVFWSDSSVQTEYVWCVEEQFVGSGTSIKVDPAWAGKELRLTAVGKWQDMPLAKVASVTIAKEKPSLKLKPVAAPKANQKAKYTLTVKAPKGVEAKGKANIYKGSKKLAKNLKVVDGKAKAKFALPRGNHKLTVKFTGTDALKDVSKTVTIRVN